MGPARNPTRTDAAGRFGSGARTGVPGVTGVTGVTGVRMAQGLRGTPPMVANTRSITRVGTTLATAPIARGPFPTT